MPVWHFFCMWVQHVVYPTVVEEEKKDQIHDQNIGETNWYVGSKDIGDRQNASRFCPLADEVARMLRLWWPWVLEDHGPLLAGGFVFFV
jgi:hypothetical protein